MINSIMKFLKKATVEAEIQRLSEAEALNSLKLSCSYFERHIQTHALFKPEYEVARMVISILERKATLVSNDVVGVLNVLTDLDNTEHYDGSGWYDFQIRLSYYLGLKGFETTIVDGKLYLI